MKSAVSCKHSTRFDSGMYTCRKGNCTWCTQPDECEDYEDVKK